MMKSCQHHAFCGWRLHVLGTVDRPIRSYGRKALIGNRSFQQGDMGGNPFFEGSVLILVLNILLLQDFESGQALSGRY